MNEKKYGLLNIYIGTFGTILLLVSCFDFQINSGSLFLVTLLLSLISFYTFIMKKLFVKIIIFGLFFGYVAIFLRQIIVSGVISINCIIKVISVPYNLNLGIFEIPNLGVGNVDMEVFIFLLTFIISMIMGYVVLVRHSLIIAMIVPVSITLFGISFDVFPSIFSITLVVAFLMSILSMNRKSKKSFNPVIPTIVFGIFFVVFLGTSILIPKNDYHRFAPFEIVRIWADNMFSGINGNRSVDKSNGGINGGKLGEVDEIVYSNIEMFELTAVANGENSYYRSFYGALYDDNSWQQLPDSYVKKYRTMFNFFKERNIDTNIQTASLFNIIDSDEKLQEIVNKGEFTYVEDVIKQEFSVSYINADSKYFYLPYASKKNTSKKSSIDGYPIENRNINDNYTSYNYNVKDIDYSKFKKLVDTYRGNNTLMSDYVKWEAEYRKFVYDAYTIMPENSLEEIKSEAKKHSVTTDAQRQEYIDEVILDLLENYKYTLSPGKVPIGKNFVEYFLYESKEGYCTYFATAATLMFRAAGIPARYVEGYSISDVTLKSGENVNNYSYKLTNGVLVKNPYNQYTITVNDSNAHAWVEIYKDGYGWVPVEVTPPGFTSSRRSDSEESSLDNTQSSEIITSVSTENTTIESIEDLDNSNSNTEKTGNVSQQINIVLDIIIVTIIIVIIGVIIIWYLMYRKTRKILSDLLSMKAEYTNNLQILNVFNYIEKICGFINISKSDFMDYEEYAKYLVENSKYFSEFNIYGIIRIVLMVRFGNCTASDEEALLVTQMAVELRKLVFADISSVDKIKFKYFYKL